MSRLSAFLNPVESQEEREVVISRRFVDEDGKAIPFRIRALSQAENDEITRKSRKVHRVNGQMQERLDSVEFSRRMVVEGTVDPDFTSTELCQKAGTLDPLEVPGRMLLAGEYSKLLQAITALSGFDDADLEDEAKN